MDITGHDNHKHGLVRIPLLIRMLHNIEEPAAIYRQHNILEGHSTFPLERSVLLRIPAERLHGTTIAYGVLFVITFMITDKGRRNVGRSHGRKGNMAKTLPCGGFTVGCPYAVHGTTE